MKIKSFRQIVFDIIEREESPRYNYLNKLYSFIMLLAIVLSLVPLMFREENALLITIEYVCVSIFIVDYFLRWLIADMKSDGSNKSFWLYPFTPMAIVDLLSILPMFHLINSAFEVLRSVRLLKLVRCLKIIRYSNNLKLFVDVIKKERSVLFSIFCLSILYIFITALIMFNVDPYFNNFYEALYWATTTLTTVGYGDIVPHNDIGRLISMISALVGVAIIALPSGVITASYLETIKDRHKSSGEERED